MGELILPGQGPSADDILFKYIFELDDGQIGSLGENLSFMPSGKNIGVSVAGDSDVHALPNLFGVPYSGGFYWDAGKGTIASNPSNRIASIYGIGKYSPDAGLLSMQDMEDAGEKFRYAGAGKETWKNAMRGRHSAYGIGHETMLRNLMNIPAVSNLVKGKDPRNGKPSSAYTNIIGSVLRDHKNKFGGRDAFSTLPKLMTFLVAVNRALEKNRQEKGKGAKNPLRELFLGNSAAANSFLTALLESGQDAFSNVLLRREGNETDEEFYERQLAEINKQRRKEGYADRSYRQYCNWVIDRMVRNIYAAARALEGKKEELQQRRENNIKFILTDPETAKWEKDIEGRRLALRDEYRDTLAYTRGAASALSRIAKRIEWVNVAKQKVLDWEKNNSRESRASALRDKMEKAEALLSSVREENKRERPEQESLDSEDAAVRKLGYAALIRDDISRQAKQALGYLGVEDSHKETRYSDETRLEKARKEYAGLLDKISAAKQEIRYWKKEFLAENPDWKTKRVHYPKKFNAALSDALKDNEKYAKARKNLSVLAKRRAELEDEIERRERAMREAKAFALGGANTGFGSSRPSHDVAVNAVLAYLDMYKERQEARIEEFQGREEYVQQQARKEEYARKQRALDNEANVLGSSRKSRLAEMRRLNPVARVMLYQMAISRGDLKTLDQLLKDGESMAPLSNSSMKMVSAGVLLGDTGMELEEVKDACEQYFQLRASPGADSENAAAIFRDLFGVDPTGIPSDERIKDFHRGWKRIEDAKESNRRIAEAVDRRFF